MASGHPLDRLAAEIISCRACPRLVAWREEVAANPKPAFAGQQYWGRPVAGFGDPQARVALVGLAPAAHGANRTGRIFTGDRSGEWLFASLHRLGAANQAHSVSAADGLCLTGVWVCSAVRCAPPANRPLPEERERCLPFLRRELGALGSLRVVVALGGFAYAAVARSYGARRLPRFGHGVEVPPAQGRPLILCSFHPSQQNTFTGRLTAEMLDSVLARALRLGDG